MARQKLSEYRAKDLLLRAAGQSYPGISIDTAGNWESDVKRLPAGRYVIKVDQGVKRRFQKGWLFVDRQPTEVAADIRTLMKQGFRYFLVEPLQPHQAQHERYVALERTREGRRLTYSDQGGVEVEANAQSIRSGLLERPADVAAAARSLGISPDWLMQVGHAFDELYFGFLEINPLVVADGVATMLDAAVQVDDAAVLMVDETWTPADYRSFSARPLTEAERMVSQLAKRSQASLSLEVINPNGAIFLLLSGGGASVVVADEVADRGYGAQLANYGEYSGNPTAEETYLYTIQIVRLLLDSTAPHKVLLIAGGVANFTDIRATFTGVMRALDEYREALQHQNVKVYVRRGGPHEAEGLAAMRQFLEKAGLLGEVAGPELVLTDIVGRALKNLPAPASHASNSSPTAKSSQSSQEAGRA